MKGYMVLEYPFKMVLYLVVIIVVIGIILYFRNEIISSLDFCWFGDCKKEGCKTVRVEEDSITSSVLDKYCSLCWQKTGAVELKEDCICYIVNGDFVLIPYFSDKCELKCSTNSKFVTFTYSYFFNKIYIEC